MRLKGERQVGERIVALSQYLYLRQGYYFFILQLCLLCPSPRADCCDERRTEA